MVTIYTKMIKAIWPWNTYNCSSSLRDLGPLTLESLSHCQLQKQKHMYKEFRGNNMASELKIEAPCTERGSPPTTFPWALWGIYPGSPSDAMIVKTGCFGQLSLEETWVFSSSSLFDTSAITILQFSNLRAFFFLNELIWQNLYKKFV